MKWKREQNNERQRYITDSSTIKWKTHVGNCRHNINLEFRWEKAYCKMGKFKFYEEINCHRYKLKFEIHISTWCQ